MASYQASLLITYVETYLERMVENMSESENQRSENLDENLEEVRLTVKEAAKYIDESPGVVRNWLRELKSHIPTIQGENGYHYFDKPALERLLLIRKLSREQNYSIKQIEYHFATGGKGVKPEPNPEVSDLILKDLQVIKDKLELQEQFNQVLVKQLEKQQQHIEHQQKQISDYLNKRDEQFLLAFQESRQAEQELAANQKKKGIFSWLFSDK
ncbi:hypothetical protein BAOM_p022 (plasmid) [Peribacillus asahii]|uniref:HTH merR-type domain-containing protein n=2 Tax=Peribacillus asahii TaxID=228899 RepID=A0A3T0KZ99_9BACI|nr:hypothetical protein BAOM_p022 [Peribacillus asahii]